SSWSRTHNDADGNRVPSRYASREEILALCAVVGEQPGTSLELLPMVGHFEQWAFDLMADMSATAQRQLNWNLLTVAADTLDAAHHRLGVGTYARSRGGKVTALTMPSDFGIRMSLASVTLL